MSRDSTRQVWAQQEMKCTFRGETGACCLSPDQINLQAKGRKCFPNRLLREDQTDVLEEGRSSVRERFGVGGSEARRPVGDY